MADVAADHGLPAIMPRDPNDAGVIARIAALAPDFLFCFYYRQMLKPPLLAIPARGALNMHGSLLPKYRGRVPVNWAVLHGERETGATLHYMVDKPDAGDIVAQTAVPILPDDTAREVFDKVTVAAEMTLDRALPGLLAGTAPRIPLDLAAGSYFGGRKPEDGRIDWQQDAQRIHNLVRAVAPPYPGATTTLAGRPARVLRTRVIEAHGAPHSPALAVDRRCPRRDLRRRRTPARARAGARRPARHGRAVSRCGGRRARGAAHVRAGGRLTAGVRAVKCAVNPRNGHLMKRVLILGVNGFIGHHLSQAIIRSTDWEIYGMDMQADRIGDLMGEPRFHFFEGDITINKEWIEYHVKKCDVVLPLVAIATPATYVREPLRVFELDFEANLPIVRACVRYKKRIVFPSTSEVYGMSRDAEFDPELSELVLGPINKPRWIYSCAKQLMDRVIHAYGQQEGLDYTLFRPFNWIGAGLDSINTAKEGSSRVITQFLGHIVRGETIKLVDGGTQKRAFTYIDDGIAALLKIIANEGGIATGKIYNIGNPANNWSVHDLAHKMLELAKRYPEYADTAAKVQIVDTTADAYYGKGYQDVQNRVPKITNTCRDLDWQPQVTMEDALARIFDAYRGQVAEARGLVD